MKKIIIALLICLIGAVLPACIGTTEPPLSPSIGSSITPASAVPRAPVIVASKIDTEGGLLGQMIIALLNNSGIPTTDKTQFGPTSVVRQALISGEIDIYPEYTGNGAFFFNEPDSIIWKDAKAGYDRVKTLDMQKNNIVWLKPSPANNTWGIAIPKALSDSKNIKSLTDFAAYINGSNTVKLIGSQEFVTSAAALPAFQTAYKFTLRQDQLIVVSSGDTAQTEKAASDGTNGVNAAMAYGTDGSLAALGLVFLADPLNVQPVYEPCPIVRNAVLGAYPNIETALDPIGTLDLTTLQSLNAQIAVQGKNAAEVARAYLKLKGFLK